MRNEPPNAAEDFRARRYVRSAVMLLALGLILLPGVAAAAPPKAHPTYSTRRPPPTLTSNLTRSERWNYIAMEVMARVYAICFGLTLGSFLNVVVYRLPRGKGLVWPPSACPACGTRIRPLDNLPIIGWLKLRGRCRACGNPISLRYPLVEAFCGLLVFNLTYIELLSGGRNLPVRRPNFYVGAVAILWDTKWDLVAIFTYHLTLLLCLLVLWLLWVDGERARRRLIMLAVAIGALAPLALPTLRPVPAIIVALMNSAPFDPRTTLDALIDGGLGILTGFAFGLLLELGGFRRPSSAGRNTLVLTLAGLYLGWQAAMGIAVVAAALRLAIALIAAASHHVRRWPGATAACVATLIHTLFWRAVVWDGWIGPYTAAKGLGAAAALTALLALVAGILEQRETEHAAVHEPEESWTAP